VNNLPLIKWHAQELHKLLSQHPNNPILAKLSVGLEASILNNTDFQNINASPPTMGDDTAASTNE